MPKCVTLGLPIPVREEEGWDMLRFCIDFQTIEQSDY
jgi:hypothetical protein